MDLGNNNKELNIKRENQKEKNSELFSGLGPFYSSVSYYIVNYTLTIFTGASI
jgi:hypothetical protein